MSRSCERGWRGLAAALCLLAGLAQAPGAARAAAVAAPLEKEPPASTVLDVAADTSLEAVLGELEPLYEREHPDLDLALTFGPSGTLRDRILRRTLPADVFISAGEAELAALLVAGRIEAGKSLPLASNRLLLVTSLRGRLMAFTELRSERIRLIALGNPGTVPLGRAGLAALQRAGIWRDVKSKIRYAASSNEVRDIVERSEVDAGLVYASDALGNPRLRSVMGLDSFAEPTNYVAALVLADTGATRGGDFIRFLRSPEARAVWTRRHFDAPD